MPMARAPPRRRRSGSIRPPARISARNSGPKTRLQLVTYAFSKLPPRQLPFLALYAYLILQAAEHKWIDKDVVGKAGAAVVGVLSMVTGLLLSYRFSSAVSKWDEGKQVWVEVRSTIRDGVRMLSIPPANTVAISPASTPVDLGAEDEELEDVGKRTPSAQSSASRDEQHDVIAEKIDELAGLIVGFAFALQHHLQSSRPLPQPPLCDLLPPAYLISLKRTEARVRFAESHAGPSGSTTKLTNPSRPGSGSIAEITDELGRPGLRRRSTGPPTKEERDQAGEDEWELGNLRDKAEEAVSKLAEAVATAGLSEGEDIELRQQLSQLNLPEKSDPTSFGGKDGLMTNASSNKPKSNLQLPYPPNLPLALLKLMEAYVVGLAEVPLDRGGWTDAKRERGLGIVKTLSGSLGEAERLSSNPPPLPLTLHLSHLLLIYLAALPCSLLCVVQGQALVLITLIAGWCLLGLEALIGEVGGVFGNSENHHPLPRFTQHILLESLDISPSFSRNYRGRLVARLGKEDESVMELDRRNKRGDEWLPVF